MLTPITDYGCFLNELALSLVLDNDQMDFFRYNLGLNCAALMAQGARYIYFLINRVLGTKKDPDLESLKHDAKKQFDEFRKKAADSDYDIDSLDIDKIEDFLEELYAMNVNYKKIENEEDKDNYATLDNEKQEQNKVDSQKEQYLNIWKHKVANFLAYCVDGGILCAKFDLVKLINATKEMSRDDGNATSHVENEISYLLHIRRDETTLYNRSNNSVLSGFKSILASPESKYIFNEKVMIVLLETGYTQRELEKENEITFHVFLKFLLEDINSEEIKMSVCRVIISKFFKSNNYS